MSSALKQAVETDRQVWEQAATLLAYQVSGTEIAAATGLSEGRISQLKLVPEFAEMVQQRQVAILAEKRALDEGWDGLEKTSIVNLAEIAKFNKDPNFNLRLAMVANKAIRRTGPLQQHALPSTVSQKVTIALNVGFAQQLQGSSLRAAEVVRRAPTLQANLVDMLPAGQVDKMFNIDPNDVLENAGGIIIYD